MESFLRIAAVLVVWGLSGCTYSVHPLLEKEHLSNKFDLSGTWELEEVDPATKAKQGKGRIVLDGFDGGSAYDLTVVGTPDSQADWNTCLIHVGQCAGRDYLQYTRDELPSPETPRTLPLLDGIPVYSFARFELNGDELRVYGIDDNWVERSLDRKTTPQIRRGEKGLGRPWLILTIPTDQLRGLVEKQGDTMFVKQPMIFRRVAKAPPKSDEAAK